MLFSSFSESKNNQDMLFNNIIFMTLCSTCELNMENGPWLAGGSIRKLYLGQEIGYSDWDIWCKDITQFEKIADILNKSKYKSKYTSQFTVTFIFGSMTIQLVKKFYNTPKEVIDDFDFSICQLITDGKNIMFGERTLHDLEHKIIYTNSHVTRYKLMPRIVKYIMYGYTPSKKLLQDLSNESELIEFTFPTSHYD